MDFLAREGSPFEADFWEKIDKSVVSTTSKSLICRRFLSIYGPLGAGTISVAVDKYDKEEQFDDGVAKTIGRRFYEVPQLYEDFSFLWRDIENDTQNRLPLDLSSVALAAQNLAKKEDSLILLGNKNIDCKGLLNSDGVGSIKKSDWTANENPFKDIIAAINMMKEKDISGRYTLILSNSLYFSLQRLQGATGMTEYQRIASMLNGVYTTSIMPADKAMLVCAEFQYMDLTVGIDMRTSYLEQVDLNHSFRILETVLPRVKNASAIVVFN